MAKATSEEDCVQRHVDYPFDIRETEWTPFQTGRINVLTSLVKPGERHLDVGCNSGYMAEFLPEGCESHGVDVSPRLVERAAKRMASAQVARAEALPFPDSSFDVVNVAEVLEHVHDPAKVLAEACRVARRLVTGTTPHEDGNWGKKKVRRHKFHVRCYNEAELKELLSRFGRPRIVVLREGTKPQCYAFAVEVSK